MSLIVFNINVSFHVNSTKKMEKYNPPKIDCFHFDVVDLIIFRKS